MSLADKLSKNGKKRLSISVLDIRPNKKNFYKIEDIDLLATQILEQGQLSNGIVYEKDEQDGKKYTLLGGERRYTAILQLFNNNLHDGKMEVDVLPSPHDEWEEKRLIRYHNSQREKSVEDYFRDIKDAEDEYNYLTSIKQTPKGLKRDWIGKEVGLSGRRVDDYLKLRKESLTPQTITEVQETATQEKKSKEKKQDDIKKLLINSSKSLNKAKQVAEFLNENAYEKDIDDLISKVQSIIDEL